jgi:hypothetical protein
MPAAIISRILAAIRIAFFKSLFVKVNLGPGSAVNLMRTDGTVIYRAPSTDGAGKLGNQVPDSAVLKRMLATPDQPFVGRSPTDGVESYYVHERINHFPLILSVGFSASGVYSEWNAQALALSVLTLAVCVLLGFVVFVLKRALIRSYEMEEQLEHMAVTDVLTQMPNRRALNMALDTEMRRAAQEKTQLSILIIDIDYFKRVNDGYGPQVSPHLRDPEGSGECRVLADELCVSLDERTQALLRHAGNEVVEQAALSE